MSILHGNSLSHACDNHDMNGELLYHLVPSKIVSLKCQCLVLCSVCFIYEFVKLNASFVSVLSFCYKLSDESCLDGEDQDAAGEKVRTRFFGIDFGVTYWD